MYRVLTTDVWFNAPGIQAAYQPVGAPDSLAARQNISNDMRTASKFLATSSALPTHNPQTGWKFNGSQYLKTNVVPSSFSMSFGVTFDNLVSGFAPVLFGLWNSSPSWEMSLMPASSYYVGHVAQNGSYAIVPGYLTTGTLLVAGNKTYRDGNLDATLPAFPFFGSTVRDFYIGARNEGSANWYCNTRVQAVIISGVAFSAAQAAQYSRQMAYCHVNPDWSAWGRRRSYYAAVYVTHELSVSDIASGTPSLATTALTQVHALASTDVENGTPSLATTALTQVNGLVAADVASEAPVVDEATLGFLFFLVAVSMLAGAVATGSPRLLLNNHLAPEDRTFVVLAESRIYEV